MRMLDAQTLKGKTFDGLGVETSSLGDNLRKLRKARELTLTQLSELSRLPLSTLSKLEAGQMSLFYELAWESLASPHFWRHSRSLRPREESTSTWRSEG
jgi:transcriptional regulator with XRE-family HTH domain